MAKLISLIIINLFFCYSTSAQKLDGLYYLTNTSLYGNGFKYINFKDNKFTSVVLQNSLTPGVSYMITEIGSGTYSFLNNKFYLNYEPDTALINMNNYDSVAMHYTSVKNQQHKIINFYLHWSNFPDYLGGGVSVETVSGKNYWKDIKDSMATLTIPQQELIKSVTFGKVGYPERILFFDNHFNNFTYNYYFRDITNFIKVAEKSQYVYTIKQIKDDNHFFEHSGSLVKAKEVDKPIIYQKLKDIKSIAPIVFLFFGNSFDKLNK